MQVPPDLPTLRSRIPNRAMASCTSTIPQYELVLISAYTSIWVVDYGLSGSMRVCRVLFCGPSGLRAYELGFHACVLCVSIVLGESVHNPGLARAGLISELYGNLVSGNLVKGLVGCRKCLLSMAHVLFCPGMLLFFGQVGGMAYVLRSQA